MNKTIRIEIIYFFLVCAFLCGLAFIQGVATTKDLEWPHNIDLYRDIGQAQTMREGAWWSDPLYLHEMSWYNPLVPGIVAVASWVSNSPVHFVYTRIGPYLNLLSPISLWILLWYLFDLWIATAGLFGFLFVMTTAQVPSWASATYSPWLFTANFVQALFYITLIVYKKALSSGLRKWYIVSGILLGVTFLGHTAPALLLGGIMALCTIGKAWDRKSRFLFRSQPLIDFALIIIPAFIASTPFTYTILGHYHLKIINHDPGRYIYHSLALNNFRSFIAENGNPLITLVACFGLIWLIFQHHKSLERKLILLWLSICSGFILYNYIWQIMGQRLPVLVPLVHFLFYLKAVEAILFGFGLVFLSKLTVGLGEYLICGANQKPKECRSKGKRKEFRSRSDRPVAPTGSGLREKAAFILNSESRVPTPSLKIGRYRLLSEGIILSFLIFIPLIIIYPSYISRDDFQRARLEALQKNQLLSNTQFIDWIQKHTQPSDGFLTNGLELYTVGLSGRKIVAVDNRFFSNPYVDWNARIADKNLMLKLLANGDEGKFMALASHYSVTYILSLDMDQQRHMDRVFEHILRKEFTEGNISIYRVLRS